MTVRTLTCIVLGILAAAPRCAHAEPDLDSIVLPPGFTISIYASDVKGCRSLCLGEGGTVFAGTREEGVVYALTDRDNDAVADRVMVIAHGLAMPNGVAFRNGSLYVSEIDRVLRLDGIERRLENPPRPVVVNDSFPDDRRHGWKFIAFGPDGRLYVPVGASCNVCVSDDPRFASIMRMRPDGSGLEIFAEGVRNTVGFDWHPDTGDLWFTDNGRDMMGDDIPPDELNVAPRKNMHFGFPYRHGRVQDPEYGVRPRGGEFSPPAAELGAHVAGLGMRFYTGSMFPAEYKNRIFIAEHGSWNRSSPVGYRVTSVRFENGRPVYEVFAGGWLRNGAVSGRPVDILVMPDGALLVSDDAAGVIYRISYCLSDGNAS